MNSSEQRAALAVVTASAAAALAATAVLGGRARWRAVSGRPGRPGAPVPPAFPPGRVVNLPGRGEVLVRDCGGPPARPAVLLLHGWTASADLNFFPAYAPLAESYRVIALDQRGHGRGLRSLEPFSLEDCADDAAALLGELGVGRAIVVGYSMGGPVGLLLARRHPERVAGLVMQATALEWRDTARERGVWRLLPALDLGLRLGLGVGFFERVIRAAVREDPGLGGCQPWLAAEFQRATAHDLVAAGRALSRYDARPWAGQLDVPAAVLVTTRDHLVRSVKQRELAKALRADVTEIDADHDLPLTKGAEYGRLTRLLVDTVAAAGGLAQPGAARQRGRKRVPPAAAAPAKPRGRDDQV
jgi:pimeloyl-ACP methyl ester carboxylesterase